MADTQEWRAAVYALPDADPADPPYVHPWTRQATADAAQAAAYQAAHPLVDRGCLIPDCPVCQGEELPADVE